MALAWAVTLSALWAGPVGASGDDEFVFRRVKWGMTIAEVRQSERGLGELGEGSVLSEEDSWEDTVVLYYVSDRLYGSPRTEIYYQFWLEPGAPPSASYPPPLSEVRLDGLIVGISMPAMGESDPAAAYEKVKATLTERYGPGRKYTDQDGPPEYREDNQYYFWTWPNLKVGIRLDFQPVPVSGPEISIGVHQVRPSAE
jgi:hypothetical protein